MARAYLQILGLEPEAASIDDLKAAYRNLARAWHPDRFPSGSTDAELASQRFQDVKEAYTWLSDNIEVWPPAIQTGAEPHPPRFGQQTTTEQPQNKRPQKVGVREPNEEPAERPDPSAVGRAPDAYHVWVIMGLLVFVFGILAALWS